jgi:hypothetical protein
MSKYEIRDDLPIPAKTRVVTLRGSKYPFAQLNIGQSFVVPVTDVPLKGAISIRAAAYNFKRTTGFKGAFLVKADDAGNVAVWRIADPVEPIGEDIEEAE